jgi:hypothetical protein
VRIVVREQSVKTGTALTRPGQTLTREPGTDSEACTGANAKGDV